MLTTMATTVAATMNGTLHTMTGTPQHELRLPPRSAFPAARYFTTLQDHFDPGNTNTWQQAYFVNDTFFDGSGPVFVCVGGEGPALDGSAVVSSVHCNDAVELMPSVKALMLAVEHRYYGCHNTSACPYSSHDSEPLRFLSSRQALADLATFHSFATREFSLTSANKWLSFGGSYPGMLAGWFRVLYPELVHASVSSSAPVVAKLDMNEYWDVGSRAYALPSVGGSDECYTDIKTGHAMIGELMGTATGNAQLAHLFPRQVSSPASLNTTSGQRAFAGNGIIDFPAQGNDLTCTLSNCNIDKICATVRDGPPSKTPLERLSKLAGGPGAPVPMQPRALSMVEQLSSDATTVSKLHRELDYWGYQTCTEFGFYQTCEVGTACMFTQGLVLLPEFTATCQAWQITPAMIKKSIDATNSFYGADRPDLARNATRILYVNGNVDPWSGLSILKPPSPLLPTLMVEGASHHAWTHPAQPSDQPSVVAAKQAINKQVLAWLAEP